MSSTLQIEFAQAMSDFKNMFPEMDDDVIEAVLRSNQGAVDATIDQLLAMSTDNQNEKIRNELHSPIKTSEVINRKPTQLIPEDINTTPKHDHIVAAVASDVTGLRLSAGASPKVKKNVNISYSSPTNNGAKNLSAVKLEKTWKPPLLGPLPPTFLRVAQKQVPNSRTNKSETELPDEQFAMMLQNEEFMNELRWNQDFMLTLERETDKERGEDDAVFKERLRCMSKKSRKKFMQLARVFTWQRHKKSAPVPKHSHPPDSLLLHEEYDEDDNDPHKLQQGMSSSQQKSANQLDKKN